MVGSMKKGTETAGLTILENPNQFGAQTLEALYDGYYDRIYAYCVHRLFCRTLAEDVTGQIFLNAAKGIDSVAGDRPNAHARWLYSIATNECNSYIRKHLRRRKLFEKFQAEHSRHQQTQDIQPDWTAVYGAIARLKDTEQSVITLRFFEDMSHDQIAAIINKHPTSVRVILSRALKKLQKLLNAADCGFENRGAGHD